MKSSYLKSKIGGTFLTLSLLFGGVIAMSVTTQAQYRDQYGRRDQRAYEREQRRRQREQIRQQRRNERVQDRYGRNDGYYGNNGNYGYGNSANLRQTALNAGYNNGVEEGRKDRSRNERYEYRDEGDYQKATEDYSSRLGDRETYRQYFRQGFANGYRAGYNGY